MDQQTSPEKIAAIVPAYNESSRIGAVLSTLVLSGLFAEIIVVDDGSTDDTESIVQTFPVTYIKNDTNKGKGFSMNRGVLATDADTIFFVDADVKGLSHVILNHILLPVLNGSMRCLSACEIERSITCIRYCGLFHYSAGSEHLREICGKKFLIFINIDFALKPASIFMQFTMARVLLFPCTKG
ncbi:MAG TPA: hypothetical protein DIS59_01550 [Candidatus Magasanikbacteria bacterium]|uniref:Glycosyltransferase involved in cell wall biogenesis n=1 Tax=Candidatus Magasanikbacteria bacterium GW2011_GWE2_42_7 TaxID=1619052 RepID=A0A0G1E8M9_9BACT|nr:MAG: Glycosyltransferase involved in cell wall biogenesis [Candidatus Magasanikbacteria bacterium GW2011_GWE2_42_7]HBB37746.1 hypothetical protein [Candidatus Magasanikbacteria bacterium]HCM53614.1 hypothetical protein [Candidatus Magasanikbacteria bacterium]